MKSWTNAANRAESLDLDPEFISEIMKAIHEESVKVQMEIMK